jgi:hypothetical protein
MRTPISQSQASVSKTKQTREDLSRCPNLSLSPSPA